MRASKNKGKQITTKILKLNKKMIKNKIIKFKYQDDNFRF